MTTRINSSVVERRPDVKGGQPVIKGTRVPVYIILEYMALGHTIAQIRKSFPAVGKNKLTILLNDISKEYKKL